MAVGMTPKALTRLQMQAAGNFGMQAGTDPTKVVTPEVSPVSYGVFGNQYAQTLGAGAQDPFFGGFDELALRKGAEQERADYDRRLTAANANALAQQQAATNFEKYKLWATANMPKAYAGEISQDGTVDPAIEALRRAQQAQADRMTNLKTGMEGFKAGREAGVTVDENTIENTFADPITGEPAKGYGVFAGNKTPDEEAKLITANAAATNASANMMDAQNPNKYNRKTGGSTAGPGVQAYSYPQNMMIDGVPTSVTIRGKGTPPGATPMNATKPINGKRLRDIRAKAQALGYTETDNGDGTFTFSKAGKPSHQY